MEQMDRKQHFLFLFSLKTDLETTKIKALYYKDLTCAGAVWITHAQKQPCNKSKQRVKSTHLVISRPSGPTRYCTIHWHASLLLDSNTSTVAIHSSVSTLQELQHSLDFITYEWRLSLTACLYVGTYRSFFLVCRYVWKRKWTASWRDSLAISW